MRSELSSVSLIFRYQEIRFFKALQQEHYLEMSEMTIYRISDAITRFLPRFFASYIA